MGENATEQSFEPLESETIVKNKVNKKNETPRKKNNPKRFILVDLKGIEPSNLTDANRALSQLSYKPIVAFPWKLCYYNTIF